ncbi:MAG: AAA family ATPase [bacterium]
MDNNTKETMSRSIKEIEKDFNKILRKKYGNKYLIRLSPSRPRIKKNQNSRKQASYVNFSLLPEELKSYLDKFIIKQDKAKTILATKICTHFHRIKIYKNQTSPGFIKSNIILIGPTGVGKTYMIKLISEKLGVPFIKADATKFSETGYIGADTEELILNLVDEAKGNIELAEHGIVYIDEVDKIASSGQTFGPDVSRTGVQRGLLKIMEETEINLQNYYDPIFLNKFTKTKINTKNILFIVSGAFEGLQELIKDRVKKKTIGFDNKNVNKKISTEEDNNTNYLQYVKPKDLVKFGFESEFIGRIPIVAVLNDLAEVDLYEILKNKNSSIVNEKKKDFKAYGIDLEFEDEALYKIAQIAYQEKTGARGLVSVMEDVLMEYEGTLPSKKAKYLKITKGMIATAIK